MSEENLRYYRITDKNIQFLGKDIGLEALQQAGMPEQNMFSDVFSFAPRLKK